MKQHVVTLRIKKCYFDAIKLGTKTSEFRSVTPFYERMFRKHPSVLKLHYQSRDLLFVSVKNIKIISCPERLKSDEISFTENIYEIELGEILSFISKEERVN